MGEGPKVGDMVEEIPSYESGPGTTCITQSGKEYRISNNPRVEEFTLWEKVGSAWKMLGVSASPLDFDDMIFNS